MTMAVCHNCGEIKFGAFVPCPKCHDFPQTEDELILSLAMTDHYFDMRTLRQMGSAVRNGTPPNLDPETRARLSHDLRSSGILAKMQGMISEMRDQQDFDSDDDPPPKKTWWRFW